MAELAYRQSINVGTAGLEVGGDMAMLWLIGIGSACVAGLLIGLRYRAPAALAASAAFGIAAAAIGAFNHASAAEMLGLAVVSIACLQIAYLAGLSISSRRPTRPGREDRTEDDAV